MQIRILCLGAGGADVGQLSQAARQLRAAAVGVRQVQLLRVLRHIPTDSVPEDRGHAGVVAEADDIDAVIECHFDDLAVPLNTAAWVDFEAAVRAQARPLFMLDTQANVPIEPRAAAARGGFRRWMLLARKAGTPEQFRDAWFGRHASLVRMLPGVDGYFQNLVMQRHDGQGRPVDYTALPIDGVAELCFADEAAMQASYASDARLPLRDDGRELLGRINTLLVDGEVLA